MKKQFNLGWHIVDLLYNLTKDGPLVRWYQFPMEDARDIQDTVRNEMESAE